MNVLDKIEQVIEKCISSIENLFHSEEYYTNKYFDYYLSTSPSQIETNSLEIDRFPQDDPYAISKYAVPLMHFWYRDYDTICKRCDKDKTLDLKEELNKLFNRYLFIGTVEQKNRESDKYDIVSLYRRRIIGIEY